MTVALEDEADEDEEVDEVEVRRVVEATKADVDSVSEELEAAAATLVTPEVVLALINAVVDCVKSVSDVDVVASADVLDVVVAFADREVVLAVVSVEVDEELDSELEFESELEDSDPLIVPPFDLIEVQSPEVSP